MAHRWYRFAVTVIGDWRMTVTVVEHCNIKAKQGRLYKRAGGSAREYVNIG
jgi:hypothetical protein